jgi:hypothetical protein
VRARAALAIAAVALALGLWTSRPLLLELTEALPLVWRAPTDATVLQRAPGDTLQLYYQLWLARDGLLGPTPLFRDPYQFRVDGPRWNLPQTFPPLALPFVLLSPLGLHLAYNLLVLLSFPLSALAAYGLVRQLDVTRVPAAAVGLAFAVVHARLAPLYGGQPAGFAAPLAPAALWGLEAALRGGRLGPALAGGVALAALATLEPHYAYMIGLAAGARVALGALRAPAAVPWGSVAAFGLAAAPGGAWLLLLRQAFLVGSIAEAGRTLAEVRGYAPGPAALGAPETYGGWILLALAVAGLAAPRPCGQRTPRLFYGALLASGIVLSLGPTLPALPLYEALHRWLPLFRLIRNPEKFRLLTVVGAVVLAGAGLAAVAARAAGPWRRAALGGLAAALVLEVLPWRPIAVTRWPDSAAYATLRAEAARVLYLPLWPGDSAWSAGYLYHATRTRVPMVNGYSPLVPRRYVAEVFEPLQGLNVGDLGPVEHAALRRLGVSHVVLDRSAFPPQVSPFPSAFTRDRLGAAPALALVRADDPLWVYRVTPPATGGAARATSPVGAFFEAEALPQEVGEAAPDPAASGGRAVRARAGVTRAGFLTFGPYRLLPAGAYRATFRVRGAGLTVEVASDRGRHVVARRAVPASAGWTDVAVPFTLERARVLEFRVAWDGGGDAAADWVLAVFADRPEPEWAFEVEALPHLLGERPDPGASGGAAGYADPGESRRIPLLTGPARLYPAGAYRLVLRARAAQAARGPLLALTVTEPAGRELARRAVDGAELAPGGYREVALEFHLDRAAVLEFPTWYQGDVGVYFDRLTVSRR